MIRTFFKNITQVITKGNTLYYPGCLTKFALPEILENYRTLLHKAGIDFIELPDQELCCGSPVLKAGYIKDFKKLAQKNLKIFTQYSIDTIITNCPACSHVLKNEYKNVLGDAWKIEVKHFVEIPRDNKNSSHNHDPGKIVTYHDPCHLGRARGIYEEPRQLIQKAGFTIKEMSLSRADSFCCGGGGGLKANNPELANKIAHKRISMATDIQVEHLVTSCPLCYTHLKENRGEIKVSELSTLLTEKQEK